ncbi:MAG: tetratricopeptide repeat protein [Clostridiales bacterium]|jgi:tetratricopeptide (TPR) repeat protein|nr:tetratricopeptide repeat protein [Clostridiales bacterium]
MDEMKGKKLLEILQSVTSAVAVVIPLIGIASASINAVIKIGDKAAERKAVTESQRKIIDAVNDKFSKCSENDKKIISAAFGATLVYSVDKSDRKTTKEDKSDKKATKEDKKKIAKKDKKQGGYLFWDFLEYIKTSFDNDGSGFLEKLPQYALEKEAEDKIKGVLRDLAKIINDALADDVSVEGKSVAKAVNSHTDEAAKESTEKVNKEAEKNKNEINENTNAGIDKINVGIEKIIEIASAKNFEPSEPREKTFKARYFENKHFTGREEPLDGIYQSLKENGKLPQIVSGIGGVGKSELAKEYIRRHESEYRDIGWINAETKEGIQNSYRKIGEEKGLIHYLDKDEEVLNKVLGWLNNNGDWLLVYDNVEDIKPLRDMSPKSGKGHIIVTTRKNDAAFRAFGRLREIKVFTPEDAVRFLKKRVSDGNEIDFDTAGAERLAKKMGYLPLALEQAAAYIINTVSIVQKGKGFDEYIRRYDGYGDRVFTADKSVYENTVYVAVMLNVNSVSEAAQQLLYISSYGSPDGVDIKTFFEENEYLTEPLNSAIKDELERDETISELTTYSLAESNGKNIVVHRLLQDAVRDSLKGDNTYIEACVKRSEELRFDFGKKEERDKFAAVEASIVSILSHGEKVFADDIRIANAYHELGYGKNEFAEYDAALDYYGKALEIFEKVLGEENPSTATSYNNIGVLYYEKGDYDGAIEYHEKALKIYEKVLGKEHPYTVTSYDNIGGVYDEKGDCDKALEYYEKALKIREKVLGKEHTDTAQSYNNIGALYYENGDYGGAAKLLKKAYKVVKKVLGEEHSYTQGTREWLRMTYDKLQIKKDFEEWINEPGE